MKFPKALPKTKPAPAQPRLSKGRQWLFRLLALTGVPLLLLGGIELALRVAGYGQPTAFFVRSRMGNRPVLIENQHFGWRFFPAHLARTPQPLVLAEEKLAGTCRIFVFGESAAMGDPEPDFGLPRQLQALLQDQFPETPFEVCNVAMTAINSHAVLEIARDCARKNGDVWVVYMGNNEVIGPFGAGTIFGSQVPPRALIQAKLAADHLRLGQLLAGGLGWMGGRTNTPKTWGGLEMFREQQVRLDDPKMARVRGHFRANLEEIIRLGRSSGARVVVSTVASNLRDCPPFGSQHKAGLTAAQRAAWAELCREGTEAQRGGRTAEALAALEKAAEIDSTFAALQYQIAECLLAAGQKEAARQAFELARDLDTLRFRTDSANNGIIREVAGGRAGAGVYLADAVEELARRSPEGIPGLNDFYEHVHFNFEGNHALAEILARQIAALVPPTVAGKRAVGRPWLGPQECARRLTYCGWNEYQIVSEIRRRHQGPPYSLQMGHAQRQAFWQSRLDGLRPALQPPALREAVAQARTAAGPQDWVLHKNLGNLLEALGDLPGALEAWQRVASAVPQYANAWHHLGNILDTQGKSAEAEPYFRKALQIKSNMVEAHNGLGLALTGQGRFSEACAAYACALKIDPAFVKALINWGLALARQKDFAGAVAKYEQALQRDPPNAIAHYNLALAQEALGHRDEAMRHFEETLRLAPADPAARAGLDRIRGRK